METKHTPGPWRVKADGIQIGDLNAFSPFDGCGCCGSPWMNGENAETQMANARLIAAAPQMLSALQRILDSFDESVKTDLALDEFPSLKAVADAIKAATEADLSKALAGDNAVEDYLTNICVALDELGYTSIGDAYLDGLITYGEVAALSWGIVGGDDNG